VTRHRLSANPFHPSVPPLPPGYTERKGDEPHTVTGRAGSLRWWAAHKSPYTPLDGAGGSRATPSLKAEAWGVDLASNRPSKSTGQTRD
jgi:hypothetical protein